MQQLASDDDQSTHYGNLGSSVRCHVPHRPFNMRAGRCQWPHSRATAGFRAIDTLNFSCSPVGVCARSGLHHNFLPLTLRRLCACPTPTLGLCVPLSAHCPKRVLRCYMTSVVCFSSFGATTHLSTSRHYSSALARRTVVLFSLSVMTVRQIATQRSQLYRPLLYEDLRGLHGGLDQLVERMGMDASSSVETQKPCAERSWGIPRLCSLPTWSFRATSLSEDWPLDVATMNAV